MYHHCRVTMPQLSLLSPFAQSRSPATALNGYRDPAAPRNAAWDRYAPARSPHCRPAQSLTLLSFSCGFPDRDLEHRLTKSLQVVSVAPSALSLNVQTCKSWSLPTTARTTAMRTACSRLLKFKVMFNTLRRNMNKRWHSRQLGGIITAAVMAYRNRSS